MLTVKRITENIDDKLTFVNEAFRLSFIKLKEKNYKTKQMVKYIQLTGEK